MNAWIFGQRASLRICKCVYYLHTFINIVIPGHTNKIQVMCQFFIQHKREKHQILLPLGDIVKRKTSNTEFFIASIGWHCFYYQ